MPGETASFILTVASEVHNAALRRGMTLTKLRAFDETASCEIVFFNQPYMKDTLVKGGEYRFRLKATNGQIIAVSEGYTAKASCLNGIESVQKNAPEAEIVEE